MNPLKLLIFGIIFYSSLALSETHDNGLYFGIGALSAASSNCDYCDYSATQFEIGYEFNSIVAAEVKYAKGENKAYGDDLKVGFIGANIGHDFNTGWFRLYGKVGIAAVEEAGISYYYDYFGEEYFYSEPSYTDTGPTAGIGIKMTLSGKASGVYVKFESLGVSFSDGSIGAALLGSIGYRL